MVVRCSCLVGLSDCDVVARVVGELGDDGDESGVACQRVVEVGLSLVARAAGKSAEGATVTTAPCEDAL